MNPFALLLLAATATVASAAPGSLSRLKRQDEAAAGDMGEMPAEGEATEGEGGAAEGRDADDGWMLMMQPGGEPGMATDEMPVDWIDSMVKMLIMDGMMGHDGHHGHGGRHGNGGRRPPSMMPPVIYNFFTVTNNTVNIMHPDMMP
ncbi:uncharacterized protein LOC122258343 [Penaeus japonicus]|uniref:uncharacterized protein LOC122258343 n=1 Tax=Penaeus japonicus TaxID=27405 RepID=UPI001C70B64D|nr:uncharacterized protein LOC122258343 [Penaeus japonicus]